MKNTMLCASGCSRDDEDIKYDNNLKYVYGESDRLNISVLHHVSLLDVISRTILCWKICG